MTDEKFNDPLADFDPVMESAFSSSDAPDVPEPNLPESEQQSGKQLMLLHNQILQKPI